MRKSKEQFIGEKVLENQEAQREFNELNHDDWVREGEALRQARLALKITLKEMAQHMGCCAKTVSRLETGKPVKRRNMVYSSYITTLKYLPLARKEAVKINL